MRRLSYSERLCRMTDENQQFINMLVMSDEAHFHLDSYANKKIVDYGQMKL